MSEALKARATTIAANTLGEAWLSVAAAILDGGARSRYDGLAIAELERVTLDVALPDPDDAVIAELADPEGLAWMRANFGNPQLVAELGDARSYASRFFDYAQTGRNQIDWVVDRLQSDPLARSATITTFEPLTDTTYIPCVSMLDFWIRGDRVELIVYAHSIDFGSKGYGNLVELAELQALVAGRLGLAAGPLVMIVKSAHVYDRDLDYMRDALAKSGTIAEG